MWGRLPTCGRLPIGLVELQRLGGLSTWLSTGCQFALQRPIGNRPHVDNVPHNGILRQTGFQQGAGFFYPVIQPGLRPSTADHKRRWSVPLSPASVFQQSGFVRRSLKPLSSQRGGA
jgi:hypothetical protein